MAPLHGVGRHSPSANEMYIRVQEGVRRMPEEIYDQACATQVQQSAVWSEEGYAEPYDLEQETFV